MALMSIEEETLMGTFDLVQSKKIRFPDGTLRINARRKAANAAHNACRSLEYRLVREERDSAVGHHTGRNHRRFRRATEIIYVHTDTVN